VGQVGDILEPRERLIGRSVDDLGLLVLLRHLLSSSLRRQYYYGRRLTRSLIFLLAVLPRRLCFRWRECGPRR
jgi:hypothetical protein